MQIAILLFKRFTALDAVGPYDVLSHLPGADVVFAAEQPGPVINEVGTLRLLADAAGVYDHHATERPHQRVGVQPGWPIHRDGW